MKNIIKILFCALSSLSLSASKPSANANANANANPLAPSLQRTSASASAASVAALVATDQKAAAEQDKTKPQIFGAEFFRRPSKDLPKLHVVRAGICASPVYSYDLGEKESAHLALNNRFLAAACVTLNCVKVFRIKKGSSLIEVEGSPFATERGPFEITWAYNTAVIRCSSYNVNVFTTDHETGKFTQVKGSPFRSYASRTARVVITSNNDITILEEFEKFTIDPKTHSLIDVSGQRKNKDTIEWHDVPTE